jgi:hypothetical protein
MPGVFVKAHRVADGYPVITGAKHNKRCYDNGSNGAESNAGQDTVLKVDRLFNKARRSVATPQAQVARAHKHKSTQAHKPNPKTARPELVEGSQTISKLGRMA